MIIKIREEIGEYCSQRQNGDQKKGGEAIRELIVRNWDKEEKIEISFEGVRLATPSFIDEAFGKLILDYPLEQLRNKLIFLGTDTATKNKINKSIEIRVRQKQGNKP